MVIHLKNKLAILMLFLLIIIDILLYVFIENKDLLNKILLFTSAFIALILSYIFSYKKGKNGLIIGLIIGITFSALSLTIHYFFAKEYFDSLYLRLLIYITSAASGGVIGVNKKTD